MRKFPEARESWIDQVVIAFRSCLIGQENSTSQFSRPITERVKDNHFNPGVLAILEKFPTIPFAGSQNGLFDGPEGVACDDEDNILVCDYHNHRVQVFNSNGEFVNAFGAYGEEEGCFKNPCGIAITKEGNIVVADSGNNRIQVF